MKTGKEQHSLRGPVQTVRIETARFKEQGGQLVEEPWFSHTITFNQEGQIVEQINRNPDGTEWHTVNDYGESGKLLVTRHYEPSGSLHSEVRYVYDAEGRLVAEQYKTLEGEVVTRAVYTYDAGLKIKTEELDFPAEANLLIGIEGTNSSISAENAKRVVTRYNERDEAVEVKLYNQEGVLQSRMEIKRDGSGNPLEETQYIGETSPLTQCSTETCALEEPAELTEEQRAEIEAEIAMLFSPGAVVSKQIHSYDREGRLIESKLTMMGMDAGRQTFAYDEFGNKTEEVNYGEGEPIQTRAFFTREYDERGNWTKEIVSSAQAVEMAPVKTKPVHITRRFISYY